MTDAAALRREAARALRLSQLIGDGRPAKRFPPMPPIYWSERKRWSARPCLQRQKPQVLRSSPLSSNSRSSLRTKRSRHTERCCLPAVFASEPGARIPHATGLLTYLPPPMPPCPMPPMARRHFCRRQRAAAAVGQLPSHVTESRHTSRRGERYDEVPLTGKAAG